MFLKYDEFSSCINSIHRRIFSIKSHKILKYLDSFKMKTKSRLLHAEPSKIGLTFKDHFFFHFFIDIRDIA